TKQNTCAGRTPANNAALKDFLRRAPLRSGLAIVRGSTTVLPKIFMVRRAHHEIKPNTCATRPPANNAALKGLAIAKGGTTVVPNIFSGEVMGEGIGSTASMSSVRSVWTLLRSNCEAIIHATEKPTIMDNVSCPACPTTGQSGIEDGKVAGRVNKTLSTSMDHTSSSSTLYLLSTIFILLNFGFISATHAQSQTHNSGGGAAEAVEQSMATSSQSIQGLLQSVTQTLASSRIKASIYRFDPDADLDKFPPLIYKMDPKETMNLRIGDDLPDELLDLPLWVVGHGADKDVVSLKEYSNSQLVVLDFWANFCAPCIRSVDQWEETMKVL